MKTILSLSAATLLLAACAAETSNDEMPMTEETSMGVTIATQEDLQALVGKSLSFGEGRAFTINADGTLAGDWAGTPLAGTYEMRDGYWCRTLTAGPSGPSPEDCQLVVLDGDQATFTRDRGAGSPLVYTVM
ncbi:hypothetical protein [Pontivivens insulae]|uniref:Uncharacterized protein n=1 Tax=Pontivivens insulae TaxID=1639689 RepID=A0A2R8ABW0_9RHOB|nr:hypothetical protein [Pontivivens insulae]RED11252.1 hypothetical protein DFR53_3285 [Pontivivens insulae]SPF29575.1 hypothetical protein POI8812_01888 [Pontivivens insulae]